MFVRQRSPTPTPPPPPPPAVVRKQKIKAEPQESQEPICPARIKKERLEEREREKGSPGVFPLVQSGSLLKCPNACCNFCALTVPDIEAHINQCSLTPGHSEDPHSNSGDSLGWF